MSQAGIEHYKHSARYHDVGGHRIAYWQSGRGECIVLIHGFPSASWDWHHLWPTLSQSRQVLALDLLGFGLSDKPHPHQYSLCEQADIVDALLVKLGIKACHILAHDYGDSVAQELLSRAHHQQLSFQLASVCFLNGGLFSESHRPLLMQKLLKGMLGPLLTRFMSKSSLNKGFKKIFGPYTPPLSTDINALWALLEHNQGRLVVPAILTYLDERKRLRQRWVDAMQQTNCPLYFINGVHDPISGQHMLARYIELIPNAHTCVLPVGHYPQLEAPQDVLHNYLGFLESINAG
jgi:pimeloyl-ACP methyl ester carboxylesterase